MNEQNSAHLPSDLTFSSAWNFSDLLLSPNESSGSHDLAWPSWPLVYNQLMTQYDETSQYLAEMGYAPVDETQAVTGAYDFQENIHGDTGITCIDKFTGSFQNDLLDVNMLDDCQYQYIASGAGMLYVDQYGSIKNEGLSPCSIQDLGLTTAAPLLENYELPQNHTSRTEEVNGNDLHVIQSHMEPSKPTLSVYSKRSTRIPKKELLARDNIRRSRIAKGIQDLEKVLPHSSRNQQETVDKSIEYVKHLQLQLKELSESRLGSENDIDSYITLKGLKFHLSHQVFLEEFKVIFGRLLEENSKEAIELLESQGLFKVPMALYKALLESE